MRTLLENLFGESLQIFVVTSEVIALQKSILEGNVYDFYSEQLTDKKQRLYRSKGSSLVRDEITYTKNGNVLNVALGFYAYRSLRFSGFHHTEPFSKKPSIIIANEERGLYTPIKLGLLPANIVEKLNRIK